MDARGRSFVFPAAHRLKSRKSIEELFQAGSSFRSGPFLFRYLRIEVDGPNQVLFSVPKRYHKLAVHRNRIKRLMREAYRLNTHRMVDQQGVHYLMAFMYLSTDIPSFEEVCSKLIVCMERLSEGRG